ncbi:hypothetical protein [Tenacibaculum sp. A30]|uniref:hypothetical protein n=1 Tax=Tenacibaculum sp. A30 TaxID=3442644 RepID=UPI003EBBCDDE
MIKKILFLLILFHLTSKSFSQVKDMPNYSFFKLVVTKLNTDKNEVLLVKWNDKWEVPGLKYNSKSSIKEFIAKMANDMGIRMYKEERLRGIFTIHYENRPKPTLMNYYSLDFVEGDITPPPSCSQIKWFSIDEALKLISYQDMVEILKQLYEDKNSVFGGAIKKYKEAKSKEKKIEFTEPLYKLAECK